MTGDMAQMDPALILRQFLSGNQLKHDNDVNIFTPHVDRFRRCEKSPCPPWIPRSFQRLPLVARAYAGGEHLRVRARAGARQALHEQLIFVPLIDTPHSPGGA